ncbi:MAG: HRDC domain-containing protein [Chloroflexota bacterium]
MFQNTAAPPDLVQSREALAELVEELGSQPQIAVDTESNSLHAYRERVCLMQFSTLKRDYVLDTLAVQDVGPLRSIFGDPRIQKIFHAAEYDILCLRRDYGFTFSNIFDTMQAGRILGRKMAGLDRLIDEKFGVKVDKRLQKANWGTRPLSPELLQYAAQDTHYLIPLKDILEAELRDKGLLELAQEDFRMACNHHNQEQRHRLESAGWPRLSTRRDLSTRELTILKELLEWREGIATRLDRPPFKVISEEHLIAIARAQPRGREDLGALGLGERQARQWGSDLLEAVARGLRNPLVQKARPVPPTAAYLRRLEKLKEWRKKAAAGMEVESDVVLPRGLLLALADRGAQDVDAIMRSSPWRLRRFGDQISAVLQAVPAQ